MTKHKFAFELEIEYNSEYNPLLHNYQYMITNYAKIILEEACSRMLRFMDIYQKNSKLVKFDIKVEEVQAEEVYE